MPQEGPDMCLAHMSRTVDLCGDSLAFWYNLSYTHWHEDGHFNTRRYF